MKKLPVHCYFLMAGAFILVALIAFWLFEKVSRNIQYVSTLMKTSEKGKKVIKEHEGLRLQAYQCSAGVWTIGYGHTSPGVYAGMTITKAEAEFLLEQDTAKHEVPVQQMGIKLSQNQFDALVSLVFNIGVGAFKRSTLYQKVLANPNDPAIADEFRRWVFIGGVTSNGLINRREKELQMYFA